METDWFQVLAHLNGSKLLQTLAQITFLAYKSLFARILPQLCKDTIETSDSLNLKLQNTFGISNLSYDGLDLAHVSLGWVTHNPTIEAI